jgi:serine/threonine protein phosphatase PrpC
MNFQPNEEIDVRLGNQKNDPTGQKGTLLTTVHTNTGGNLAGRAHIPLVSPGVYHLYFMDPQCSEPVIVDITLQAFTPWVVLDNYAPHPHDLLGFRGQAFAPNEPVQVYLNDQHTTPVAQARADNSGQFAMNQAWDVGDLTGDNTLLFVGTLTGLVVSVKFTVIPPQPGAQVAPFLTRSPGHASFADTGELAVNGGSGTPFPFPASAQEHPGDAFRVFTIDPTAIVLGLLVVWLILCIALVLMLSIAERFPRLRLVKWWSRRSAALNRHNMARGSVAEFSRWLKKNQHRLPTPGIQVSSRTDRGYIRADREQEDGFLAVTGTRRAQGQPQPFALLVLADSVGRFADGQSAGRRTIDTIFRSLAPRLLQEDIPCEDLSAHLESTLQGANQLLYWRNQRESSTARCSVTAALVSCHEATICNVGNCRAYLLLSHVSLRRVTTDHSIAEMRVAAGKMQCDDVCTGLSRSRVYRSLGQHPDVQVDSFRLPIGADDQLLLCSDGLWEILSDADLEMIMRQHSDVTLASNKLIGQAKAHGGLDHITAIVMKLTEYAPSPKQSGIDSIAAGSTSLSRPHIFRFFCKAFPLKARTLPLLC